MLVMYCSSGRVGCGVGVMEGLGVKVGTGEAVSVGEGVGVEVRPRLFTGMPVSGNVFCDEMGLLGERAGML